MLGYDGSHVSVDRRDLLDSVCECWPRILPVGSWPSSECRDRLYIYERMCMMGFVDS